MNTNFKPKLYIDHIVESKIRYLANKYPSNEWSGILFVEYNGYSKGFVCNGYWQLRLYYL